MVDNSNPNPNSNQIPQIPALNDSLPPPPEPVAPVATPTKQVASVNNPAEDKLAFPEDYDNQKFGKANKILKYLPLILSLAANVALAIFLFDSIKEVKSQKTATNEMTTNFNKQKAIVDAKSNCEACPAAVQPAAETSAPTQTTTTKRSTTTSQETVIAPPAPPSD